MKGAIAAVCILCFATVLLPAAADEPILVQNGTIVPVVGKPIPGGCLLIEKGRIVRIAPSIPAPARARVIDAKGLYVYPGMIAPLTAIGLVNHPGATADTNETGISTPQMDPADALNPEDECIAVARLEGVTTVLTAAGSANVIDGKAVVLNLEGDLAEQMIVKRDALMVFNVGARAGGKYPSTLPGIVAFLREKLDQARVYADRARASLNGETVRRDLELEALVPVVKGEMPALFVTQDEVTIRAALELIAEFRLRGILFATADIQKFADQLAARKIPVIWGGTTTLPRRWEPVDVNYHAAAVLAQKGVLFAFSESHGLASRNVRRQPQPAAISVAFGLAEDEALYALTINPAYILGVHDQMGSLEAGKMANVIICTKPLLQLSSRIVHVIINGKVIPRESVQTKLNERFTRIVRERIKAKTK